CSSCGALYTIDYCCSNGSLVDKIICDLNKAPDSPHLHTFLSNQRHCFHCKDVLGDDKFCQRCTCTRCGSGLSKGLCLICKHNQNSLNDSPSISENSSQSPPHINHHCCYECGDPLEGILCRRCTCKLCGNGAHYGYNCPLKFPIIPNPKPFNNQTNKELPSTFPSFDSKSDLVHDYPNVFDPPSQLPFISCELCGNDAQEKQIEEDQAANARYWKILAFYDDDDDDYAFAITPNEPVHSLSMGDEHLDTIPGESECDVPAHDEFTTFSNILFDDDYEFNSNDDQSSSNEDVQEKIFSNPQFDEEIIPMKIDQHHHNAESDLMESLHVQEKIFSNPQFDEEIIPMKIDQHHYNAESDLMESLRTYDSSIIISSKIDSLLDEFADELALLKSISPGIDETDCDFEEEICLIEKLLYDNSSPRPPEEFVSANSDTETESFSPSPISVEDSDSLMEEIDLSFTPDYPMPSGIEDDDYDSEREILISEDLPSNDTLSLPKTKSFYFDIPSFSRPPAKPSDGNTGILNVKMMGDISKQKVHMSKLMITLVPN
nr:hypothetical protein [Tanacetum cinerariifolium]